jgi:hypothetical protein
MRIGHATRLGAEQRQTDGQFPPHKTPCDLLSLLFPQINLTNDAPKMPRYEEEKKPSKDLETDKSRTAREIITIQAGQCGNSGTRCAPFRVSYIEIK